MAEKIGFWEKVRLSISDKAAAFRRKVEASFLARKIASHPLGALLISDATFRSKVFLFISLLVNFSYGTVQLFSLDYTLARCGWALWRRIISCFPLCSSYSHAM